ncbi:hypothetical protein BH09SUM1_BH09SUM1_25420 [soil metagenome]
MILHKKSIAALTTIALAALCACDPAKPAAVSAPTKSEAKAMMHTVSDEVRYNRIREFIGEEKYGPGGLVVLEVAYRALAEKHAAGEGKLVDLEDMWAESLQEGESLFNKPDMLWGKTTAEQTSDMIGQTTIGPWQMTIGNIRKTYGPPYGVDPNWPEAQVYVFCREHPEVQAKMIIDYMQQSYETFGKRSPYAIQRYFWLDPYVKGEIGQSPDWTKGVVAKPPKGGTWKDLTPEAKADTGFYSKQVLMGTAYTDTGMIFWLYVSGDIEGLRETLRTWRDEKRIIVAKDGDRRKPLGIEGGRYVRTDEPGNFAVKEDDVKYYKDNPEIRDAVRAIIREVNGEKEMMSL